MVSWCSKNLLIWFTGEQPHARSLERLDSLGGAVTNKFAQSYKAKAKHPYHVSVIQEIIPRSWPGGIRGMCLSEEGIEWD